MGQFFTCTIGMQRRGFLGQLLGLVAGVPFYGRLISQTPPEPLSAFRLVVMFAGDPGSIYHAPQLADIKYQITKDQGYLTFVATPIDCRTDFSVTHWTLLDGTRMLSPPRPLSASVFARHGDILKLTYNAVFNGHIPPDTETAINALRSYNFVE